MREQNVKWNFYPKLAWSGIQKNKRLYFPYLLTCIGMIMMYYILAFLADSGVLQYLKGGDSIQLVLSLGTRVIAIFSLIFLFYTNSFLIRRRKKEFGLYNILGMGKRNLARILIWETVMTFGISFLIGTFAGVAFSKLAELALVNIMQGEVTYTFSVSLSALKNALLWFAVIFLLILLNTLRQIHTANPVALLRSENTGEKAPKANWVLGIAGAILLGAAYYLAVSIEEPLSALLVFFFAVIMVIVATYLLFIAGSVVLCRILQKNKKYYYKANHFVSVSSMAYRMKRNGAGLASICILITMVLVMLASTTCLYIGSEDSIRARYPRDVAMSIRTYSLDTLQGEQWNQMRESLLLGTEAYRDDMTNELEYVTAATFGYMKDGCIETDVTRMSEFSIDTYDKLVQVYYISLADYNRLMGKSEELSEDEAFVYTVRLDFEESHIAVNRGKIYRVKEVLEDFIGNGSAALSMIPSVFIVVPDLQVAVEPLIGLADYNGNQMIQMGWYYGFDMDTDDAAQLQALDLIYQNCRSLIDTYPQEIQSFTCEAAAHDRADFYGTYGGLFFIGIMLSIVFVFAAVLIIYYKQISEGYEDQSRFEIMQKVGMTKRDIRRCINSQMLTVFYLPLLAAGMHLAFAFPLIQKLLMLFNLMDIKLLILTTVISFMIFALFYMLVYRKTSKAYYVIVSDYE